MKKGLLLFLPILLAAGCNLNSSTTQTSTSQNTNSNLQVIEISANNMSPTLKKGDYASIDESVSNYNRGDIIVFKYPKDQSQLFVQRIVGLPGEQIEIKNGGFYINGNLLAENQYLSEGMMTYGLPGVISLKSDEYFVAGDNRTASSDSRVWGALNKNLIVGKFVKKIQQP